MDKRTGQIYEAESDHRYKPNDMPAWLFDACKSVAKDRRRFAWLGLTNWTFGLARSIYCAWWMYLGPLMVRLTKPTAAPVGEAKGES